MGYGGLSTPIASTPKASGGYQGLAPATPVSTPYNFPGLGAPMPTRTVAQKIGSDISSTFNTPSTATTPLTPESFLTAIYGPQGTALQGGILGDTVKAWQKVLTPVNTKDQGSLENAVSLANKGVDTLNAFFTPVSSTFKELAKVQGPVGEIGNFVNKFFSSVGSAGGDTLSAMVQDSNLSDEHKAILTPLANEIGALGAQIAIGKAGGDAFGALKDKTTSFLSTIAEDSRLKELQNNPALADSIAKQTAPNPTVKVPVTSESTGYQGLKINTPTTKFADYNKSQGYEPITPDSQLPTIKMGVKAKPTEPVVRMAVRKGADLPGYTVEPIKSAITSTEIPVKASVSPETASQAKEVSKPAESTPITAELPPREAGTTKTASDINQNLVKQGFDALPSEQQAKYTPQSYKEIAGRVASMMDSNIEQVKSMARGDIPIPKDINPEILFNAVEAHAMQTGDAALLQDLAKSPVSKTSEAGQTLGGHGFNDNPNSVVAAIKEVQQARESSVSKRGANLKQETVTRIKEAIRKTNTKESWSDFISSIQC